TWSRSCCRSAFRPAGGSSGSPTRRLSSSRARCSSARTSSSPTFRTISVTSAGATGRRGAGARSDRPRSGARATLWYTRKPRDQPMKIVLTPDGPLDVRGTLARYHRWGDDPTNRVADDVLRRGLRGGRRLIPYEVRWSGSVDDARIVIRIAGAPAVGEAAVVEGRRILGSDLECKR